MSSSRLSLTPMRRLTPGLRSSRTRPWFRSNLRNDARSPLPWFASAVALSLGASGCAGSGAPSHTAIDVEERAVTPLRRGAVSAEQFDISALDSTGFVGWDELVARLSEKNLVCVGEEHDNLSHHAMQLRLARDLLTRASSRGAPVALGFEMFQRPAQPFLDAYAAKEIDAGELLERSEYARRWGYDFEYYREALEFARDHGGKLLALNAPREWTKAVAKSGLAGLTQVNATLEASDLVLDDPEHQHFFGEAMGAFHPKAHSSGASGEPANATAAHLDWSNEPFYAAQVVWDETMADTAATWVEGVRGDALAVDALVVVFAGAGHCHESAIPRRFERRVAGSRAVGIQLRERSSMAEPSIPAASSFDWVLVAEGR